MFLYQGWYLCKEKETPFLTSCMVHFGLTVTSLLKSRHQHEAPLVQVIFTLGIVSLLDRVVTFLSQFGPVFYLFLIFFSKDFLLLLIFP